MLAPRTGTHGWNLIRDAWQHKINANNGWTCRRCGGPIPPRTRGVWHLGHPHDMTTGPTLLADLEPEHARCNTSAGATAGNTARAPQPLPASRRWYNTDRNPDWAP